MIFVPVPSDERENARRLFGEPAPNHAGCFACNYGSNGYGTTAEKIARLQYLMVRGRRTGTVINAVPKIAQLFEDQIRAPANRKRRNMGMEELEPWSEATIYEHIKEKVPADALMWKANSLELFAEVTNTHANSQTFRRNRHNREDKRVRTEDGNQLIKYQLHQQRLHNEHFGTVEKGATEDMIIAKEVERDLVLRPLRFSLARDRVRPNAILGYKIEQYGVG